METESWFRQIAWTLHWANAKKVERIEDYWPIEADKLRTERPVNNSLFKFYFQRKAQEILERKYSTYQKHLIGRRA